MKKKILITLGLGGWLVSLLLFFVLRSLISLYSEKIVSETQNPFPAFEEVESVRFDYNHFLDQEEEDAHGFLNPAEIKALSLVFEGSYKDIRPAEWQVLGSLDIQLSSGDRVDIYLFSSSSSIGAFKMDGQYYRGGEDEQFKRILKDREFKGFLENDSVKKEESIEPILVASSGLFLKMPPASACHRHSTTDTAPLRGSYCPGIF